jgi:hypothetical protein
MPYCLVTSLNCVTSQKFKVFVIIAERTDKAVLKPVNICIMLTGCRWGKLKEGDYLEDLDIDERMLLE